MATAADSLGGEGFKVFEPWVTASRFQCEAAAGGIRVLRTGLNHAPTPLAFRPGHARRPRRTRNVRGSFTQARFSRLGATLFVARRKVKANLVEFASFKSVSLWRLIAAARRERVRPGCCSDVAWIWSGSTRSRQTCSMTLGRLTQAVSTRNPGVENMLETCAAAFSFAAWTCAPATRMNDRTL